MNFFTKIITHLKNGNVITGGTTGLASDFIKYAEKDATPANDEGRVPQLESDGKLHRFFSHQNQKSTLVAGETITGATTPQACFIMSEQRINRFKLVMTQFATTEAYYEVYNNGAGTDSRIGQRFSSGANDYIKAVAMQGSTEGSLSEHNYIAEIFAVDGSGNPTGAAIGSQAFTVSQYFSSSDIEYPCWYIEFSTPVAVSQSTNYIITFRETTTTGSSTVNMHIYTNSAPTVASRYTTNGSTWNAGVPSWSGGGLSQFILYGNITQTIGRVYLSDGNDADKNYFDGFVYETDTAGNNVDLYWGNDLPFFTGLVVGTSYYLSDTAGAITATKARGKKVGFARSTTALSISDRPEKSEQYNSKAVSEYDFGSSSTVPFYADAFLTAKSATANNNLYLTMSNKFHEALWGYIDKRFDSSDTVTGEKKDGAVYVKQGQYVKTQISGASVSEYIIWYDL